MTRMGTDNRIGHRRVALWLTIMQLVLSVAFLGGSVFAWYNINVSPRSSGVGVGVIGEDNAGFVLLSVDGKTASSMFRKQVLAGDEMLLEIEAREDDLRLSLAFLVRELSDIEYSSVLGREDLLMGPYQRIIRLNPSTTYEEERYFSYDIQNDPAHSLMAQKLEFLKLFAINNNIVSAFSAEIVAYFRNGQQQSQSQPWPLIRNDEADSILYIEANEFGGPLVFNKGDTALIRLSYGKRMLDQQTEWLPTMSIDNSYQMPEFRAQNLNCFIGQNVSVRLKTLDA